MPTDTETTPESDIDVLDVAEDQEVSDTPQDDSAAHEDAGDTQDQELGDAEHSEAEGEDGDAEELVEVEWEGKTLRITPEAKAALMRTADYTRKTQEVAETRKALEARQAELAQQAEQIQQLSDKRIQLALMDRQLAALDAQDWDKLEAEDPDEAGRLSRQQLRLKTKRDNLASEVEAETKDLTLKSQQAAKDAHAKAVEDCQAVLSGKDGIKGWSPALADKLAEFAITQAGYTPNEVVRMTDPRQIKLIHQAYVGAQAQARLRGQQRLETQDKAAPVKPPGGQAPGAARRTTDSSGDGLSTAEWIARENAREAAKRTGKQR